MDAFYCYVCTISEDGANPCPILALCIFISSTGLHATISISRKTLVHPGTHLSFPSVRTAAKRCSVGIPLCTRPKMVCLPSRNGVGARVRKN